MPHDPLSAVLDMIQAIEKARRLSAGSGESEFLADERSQWAVFSQIVILGEAASRLPRDFRALHPAIPWQEAIGMRHRLVHGYDDVDWQRVWKTLRDDLPSLLEQLKALMPEEGGRTK